MDSSSLSDGTSKEFISVVGAGFAVFMAKWFSDTLLFVQDVADNMEAIMRIMAEMDKVLSMVFLV